ncbi:hypothetical protein A2755_03850 [Candidatus Wolfebacteria bacterium RIFCSPHIGHO2_01_FULL_48_22]|uniref:Toxin-antitoxin system protein n=2 Tax=Candidatus Wolfeibacteriota TaxID=1752735 RepID=A0A1F8DPG2_9BACT|nr:MAG: hypothetical protein A2755_03850 [Candidatus Wolfebacteria bacterium RIFCSPHIGHO2_01_FULL_48_22]OGM93472.1 MAG: hypothetical protein A2935_01200 [Candidatus Wolfebacteria bacterium RIFCSPLOWO2_01_FULL_47_17b]
MKQNYQLTRQELREFVDWTRIKIKLHASPTKVFPHKREIWWISVGKNIGVEINGKNERFERPVLVVKRFNDESSFIVPVTSRIKFGKYFYMFTNKSGEKRTINLSQARVASHKRFLRKVEKLGEADFSIVIKKLCGML